ncbi:hypothetical protein LTR66_016771 [Elasticomyces elasticus]|nr:hypothetical protein LTR66_016771 [Elasticomyces elasticus]
MVESVIQLKCECSNYPWGKVGEDSLAARLCSATPYNGFKLEKEKSYAEMWMGTYPTTPSYVLKTGELLQDVINANKEQLVGKTVLDKFGADLPFLPKILSIQKALPLQIHPDIELSKKLHKENPDQFGDTNHKPEIAVALSFFEAFCGFKPKSDIQQLLELEPLKQFRPKDSQWTDSTMRELCKNMLVAPEKTVADTLKALGDLPKSQFGSHSHIPELVPRLISQYGQADNGSLVTLILMNFLTFQPGEAICIPADGIHAYLKGDIVECMARSDNVLNTGFCPRADRDSVDLFVSALTFKQHDSKKPLLDRVDSEYSTTGKTTAFKPPMGEFNMLVTQLGKGDKDTIKEIPGPSVAFMTSGGGRMTADGKTTDIKAGYIYFIGQGVEVSYESSSSDFAIYRAYAA